MSENERLQNLVRGHTEIPEDVLEPLPPLVTVNMAGYPIVLPKWLYDMSVEQKSDLPLWKEKE